MQPTMLASAAVSALIGEARLAPKPGLVDSRGTGAHHDMDLDLLVRSATALQPAFTAIADAARGRPADLAHREEIGAIGRRGEADMLLATRGVNTHRGALWALGLLVAAVAAVQEPEPAAVAGFAAALARLPDRHRPQRPSHGDDARRRYGVGGATGQAAAGFPLVFDVALPSLRAARLAGRPPEIARLDALLAVMARLDDTCVLHRGGAAGLAMLQSGASAVLAAGGSATAIGGVRLAGLDTRLRAAWLSPGGSADLLAAALFCEAVLPGTSRICASEGAWPCRNSA